MQLVAPDILADACGLSIGLVMLGMVLGLALWLFGWHCHRFWIVLITTVLAGVYGLYEAPAFRAQPLVAAVLLALAAGLLALALVRLLAFLAGGMAGLLAIQAMAPSLDQPLICFIISGLVSLFLFRLSVMVLTSLTGTILLGYSGLCLLNHYGAMDAVAWTDQGAILLNWMCGLMALLGFGFQFLLDRRRGRRDDEDEEDEGRSSWRIFPSRSKWGSGKSRRKAG